MLCAGRGLRQLSRGPFLLLPLPQEWLASGGRPTGRSRGGATGSLPKGAQVSWKAGPWPVNRLRSGVRGCDCTMGAQGRSHPPGAGGPGPPPVSSALPEPRTGVLPACARRCSRPVPPTLLRRHRPTRPQASRGAGLPPLGATPVCPLFLAAGSFLPGLVRGVPPSLGAGGSHQLSRILPRPPCSALVSGKQPRVPSHRAPRRPPPPRSRIRLCPWWGFAQAYTSSNLLRVREAWPPAPHRSLRPAWVHLAASSVLFPCICPIIFLSH